MPIFGINIEKERPDNKKFVNTYYVNQSSIESAMELASSIADAEKNCFADKVTFKQAHVWQVGSNPPVFSPVTLSGTGLIVTAKPCIVELVAKVNFFKGNTYPSYKAFRLSVDGSKQDGTKWASSVLSALSDFAEDITELFPKLCDRNGTVFEALDLDYNVYSHKYNKRWYNRATE